MTTKTIFDQLAQLKEDGYVITRQPVKLATELKQVFSEVERKIRSDRDLTPEAKARKIDEERAFYGKQVLESAAKMKAEYIETAKKARALALQVKTTGHAVPKDATLVKLFEQELTDVKLAASLGFSAGVSLKKIDTFIQKYGDNPYFAQQIKADFPSIAGNVLTIEQSVQNRQALGRLLEQVESKAVTPEIQSANDVIAFYEGAESKKLFLEGLPAYNAIRNITGDVANQLNDAAEVITPNDAPAAE